LVGNARRIMNGTSQPLWLPGYAPLPLAHYLKALAVLPLLSQQPDPNVTGSWKREVLLLTSPKLKQKNTMKSLALHPYFLHKWRMLWRILPSGATQRVERFLEPSPCGTAGGR
jgi:hypothetical protein